MSMALSVTPSPAASEDNVAPSSENLKGSANGTTLQGRVSMTDLTAPTPQRQWEASVLPNLKIGARLLGDANVSPEGLWYKIPEWIAGTWDVTYDKPDTWHKGSTEKMGRVRDRNGDIWSYSRGIITSRPWEEGADKDCTVINIMGGAVPQYSNRGAFDIRHRNIGITKRKNNSIIRMLVSVELSKYVRLSSGQLHEERNMHHLINEGFDGVIPGDISFRTWTKTAPFKQDESMVPDFYAYLRSHNMNDLIPIDEKS
jgi:hypothetical protein